MNKLKLFIMLLIAASTKVSAHADSTVHDQNFLTNDKTFCVTLFKQKSHGGKISQLRLKTDEQRVSGNANSYHLTARTSNGYDCQCELSGSGAVSDVACVRLGSARGDSFDNVSAQSDRYHSSQEYQQKLRTVESDQAAIGLRNYNLKILNEAKAFAKYHGGSSRPLAVSYAIAGVIESIDLETRDGLTSRCLYSAFRLTCDCVDKRTLDKWKVEFRSAYGGIEKRIN